MSGVADPADEQVAHGEEDHGLGHVEASFVIADEAAVAGHPADTALDHPAARDHLEARIGVAAAYDLDHEIEEGGLVEQLAAVVGPVGEEVLDPRPALADGRSVILDLKWNRSDKYRRKELRENRAMQLAAYTWLEKQAGRQAVGAGYFMLRQQSLIYSEPDPFPASHHVPGTDLGQLWIETQAVYDRWMADIEAGTLVARGVETEDGAVPEDPMPRIEPGCRFCDYRLLCGAELKEKRK